MEYNKDLATMVKAIAESKLERKDYIGAKKFALKANCLYRGLNGISEMLAVVDVYLRAVKLMIGEPDWYHVLDVHPLAEEDIIKKQYKKLSLMVHPDKNMSLGAAGAFHLISHAYRLLKDRQLRYAFDQRSRLLAFPLRAPILYGTPFGSCWSNQHSVPPYSGGQSVPAGGSSAVHDQPTPKSRNRRAKAAPTFWTICSSCRTHFEYDRIYLWRNLRCQECNSAFPAIEIARLKFSGSGPVPWKRKSQSAREEVGSSVVPLEHEHLKRSKTQA